MSKHCSKVRYACLGFIGLLNYRVGTDGSVWSKHNNKWGLGPWKKMKGPTLGLRKNGAYIWFHVSRLVLLAFVGPCPPGMEACHFPDRDRNNNALNNLRWATHKDNEKDKIEHGTRACGERNGHAKLTVEVVKEMRKLRKTTGMYYEHIAKKFGVSTMTAYNAIVGKRWFCV